MTLGQRALIAGAVWALLSGVAPADGQESRSFAPAPARPPDVRPARLDRVQALIDLAYAHPRFDLDLELPRGGVLARGERFDVVARADRPAVLLVLDVDPMGVVTVLHPLRAAELEPTSRLRTTCEAVAPYGREVLKLFAFGRAPEGLDRWLGRQVDAGHPDFDRLLRLLREPGTESAEARLVVLTADDADEGRRR